MKLININIPEKYISIIEAEAAARKLTVEQLFLTAIADYLPRGAVTPEGRLMPLQLHMKAKERKAVVPAAEAAHETVNHYVVRAIKHRLANEKKIGAPWPHWTEVKRHQQERSSEAVKQAAAAGKSEAQAASVEAPLQGSRNQ